MAATRPWYLNPPQSRVTESIPAAFDTLADELADLRCRVGRGGRVGARELLSIVELARDRVAGDVVDRLDVDVLVGPEHSEARALAVP